jgi:hypothetical protein
VQYKKYCSNNKKEEYESQIQNNAMVYSPKKKKSSQARSNAMLSTEETPTNALLGAGAWPWACGKRHSKDNAKR